MNILVPQYSSRGSSPLAIAVCLATSASLAIAVDRSMAAARSTWLVFIIDVVVVVVCNCCCWWLMLLLEGDSAWLSVSSDVVIHKIVVHCEVYLD